MGYVELKPGRGAFAVITSKESELKKVKLGVSWLENNAVKIYEWQEARMCLEPHMAYLAAQKAADAERMALSRNVSEFEKAVRAGELGAMCSLECDFHNMVARMAHNSVITGLYNALSAFFAEFVTNNNYQNKNLDHTVTEHKKVADAICGGDAYAAKKAMEEHLNSSVNKLPM